MSMRLHGLSFLRYCAVTALFACACNVGVAADTVAQAVKVVINASHTHRISPYIYGINNFREIDGVPSDLTLDRKGGNRLTAYNWETNASNAGSDYLYQNDNSAGDRSEPGSYMSSFIAQDQKIGMASLITVQMQGLVAGDSNGPVAVTNPPDKTRFKQVFYEKKVVSNEPFTAKPSAADDYVYMDEFIWALDHKFAGKDIFGAKASTQPVFVSLDNEPELWNTTHLEVQGKTGITADSYIARTIALATALKKQFPDIVIFGPANYGFLGLYSWNGQMNASPSANNWFADKYLTSLKTASDSIGKPLVNVYDFHWYPEAADSTGTRIVNLTSPTLTEDQVQAIVQSPRSLWDKTYKERSWIINAIGQPLDILDRLQTKIDAENPGMKLAITEYDNGGGQHIAGTIAQADNLGIYGAHNLFAATMWLLAAKAPYSLAGFRAYRNFDGANHNFGDTSVEAISSNAADVACYVSTDSTRPGRVVMVAINRSTSAQQTEITGQPVSGSAHLFQMTAVTAAKQGTIKPVSAGVQPVTGSTMTLKLPPLSVTTVDIY